MARHDSGKVVEVMPSGWKVVQLGEVAEVVDPQPDHRTPPEVRDGVPYVGVNNFNAKGEIDIASCRTVSEAVLNKQRQSFRLSEGSIIFGKIGTIGEPRFLPQSGTEYALSANVVVINPTDVPPFILNWLKSEAAARQIEQELHTTSQPAFGIHKIRGLRIAFPPLAEQRKIAAILSTWDKVLEKQEALIEAKQQRKRALMQQLLTGKRRFKEFEGQEWTKLTIGEIAEVYQPRTVSSKDFSPSGYPVFGANGEIGYYPQYNHETWQTLVGCRGSCGLVNRSPARAWITGNAMVLNVDKSTNVHKPFFYYLMTIQNFQALVSGSSQPQITKRPIEQVQIQMPSTVQEQQKIAAVLSTADAEIEALQKQLAAYKEQKRGLMQQLLTGKKRVRV